LKKSYFHVSDEPHGEAARANYMLARGVLKELAPWMQVMDALSEIEFGRGGLPICQWRTWISHWISSTKVSIAGRTIAPRPEVDFPTV